MTSLLQSFFASDCDITARKLLLADIRAFGQGYGGGLREYTFNRFNITIDFSEDSVTIEDDLDPTDEGSCVVSLQLFTRALDRHDPEK